MGNDTTAVRTLMRADLKNAMKARDRVAVSALRSALAAFDNAEAVPPSTATAAPTAASSEYVAATAVGLGSAEAERRELTTTDIQQLLAGEIDERMATADLMRRNGRRDTAEDLLAAAEVLRHYRDDPSTSNAP